MGLDSDVRFPVAPRSEVHARSAGGLFFRPPTRTGDYPSDRTVITSQLNFYFDETQSRLKAYCKTRGAYNQTLIQKSRLFAHWYVVGVCAARKKRLYHVMITTAVSAVQKKSWKQIPNKISKRLARSGLKSCPSPQ